MAIEKMALVGIVGNMPDLDATLLQLLKCGYFHPENSIHGSDSNYGFKLLEGENPYNASLNEIKKLANELGVTLKEAEFSDEEATDTNKINNYISDLNSQIDDFYKRKQTIKENISQYEQSIIQFKHLDGLNVNFDDIFGCEYVKVRFGRIPVDSYKKLSYYDKKTFFFFTFDHDDEYYWGVYFAPVTKIAVIDDIFNSLYFERIRVPDFAHGTPAIAIENVTKLMEESNKQLGEIDNELNKIKEKNEKHLLKAFSILTLKNAAFNLRKHIASINSRFYCEGFIPAIKAKSFVKLFENIKSINCTIRPYDADPSIEPPVKLKNNKFAAPFEQFVNMYSLPSYKDIDPTSLVAISYTLLFGIMFGDVGQGIVLAIIGFILSKFKQMNLGKIMTRIGFSSAFFGLCYGSVFGYEHMLDPMYKAMGFSSKPIEVFDTNTTSMILLGAIVIGITLIVISICINIYLGFRNHELQRALFSHNGIAGLVLYLSAAFAVADMMLFHTGIVNTVYIICLIVLPLLLIFFQGPLAHMISKKKVFEGSIGEFFIENFFELFEYVLSYLSNSMSFLRVGGFILSHAGMMAVVMTLSEMVGSAASIPVVIIGNIFVMCLEGLIVGIQVLRLEFYEIFSRNFEGNGKPFVPATVDYSNIEQ